MRQRRVLWLAAVLMAATGWLPQAWAAAPRSVVQIAVSLAMTGPDARWGVPMLRGIELAVEEANRGGDGPGGHPLETLVLDSAGPGLEGISRWRGMHNYERLIADPAVVAVIGPQTSGEGRAVAPLLSHADMATITQMEAMARFAHGRLGVRRVVLIDDGTDFGERMALTFARQAGAQMAPDSRLTPRRPPSTLLGTMQVRDTGRTGFFGYYFSYRLPGGPMP